MEPKYEFTIENYRYQSHDLDDEVVYFYFEIIYSLPEPLMRTDFVPFRKLLNHLKTIDPDFFSYISEIRSSLDLFGVREKTTLETMGEEALSQLFEHLKAYIYETKFAETSFEHYKGLLEWQETMTGEQELKQTEIVNNLMESAIGLKEYQQKYRLFCETATRRMRDTAFEIYPEIADLEPEKLRAFKYVFIDEIMRMHTYLEKLLNENE